MFTTLIPKVALYILMQREEVQRHRSLEVHQAWVLSSCPVFLWFLLSPYHDTVLYANVLARFDESSKVKCQHAISFKPWSCFLWVWSLLDRGQSRGFGQHDEGGQGDFICGMWFQNIHWSSGTCSCNLQLDAVGFHNLQVLNSAKTAHSKKQQLKEVKPLKPKESKSRSKSRASSSMPAMTAMRDLTCLVI